jgi:hypothetical protein
VGNDNESGLKSREKGEVKAGRKRPKVVTPYIRGYPAHCTRNRKSFLIIKIVDQSRGGKSLANK